MLNAPYAPHSRGRSEETTMRGPVRVTVVALMTTMLLAAFGCGRPVAKPWDKNHDGAVGPCEGLVQDDCAATPGCSFDEPFTCPQVCQDPGDGGCVTVCGVQECHPVRP